MNYTSQKVLYSPKDAGERITADYWNSLFQLIVSQGNHIDDTMIDLAAEVNDFEANVTTEVRDVTVAAASATLRAHDSADAADSAATHVDAAVATANQALSRADTAIATANAAATEAYNGAHAAEQATIAANNAKSAADTVTGLANTAANNANVKATLAKIAATNADNKAAVAQAAATLANTRAGEANIATNTANNAETARVTAEGLREQAEAARQVAYGEAESARDGLYNTAEGDRGAQYATAETAREALYHTTESGRDTQYDTAEAQRDVDYSTAEAARDVLYNTAELDRDALFQTAEDTRQQGFAEFEDRIVDIETNKVDTAVLAETNLRIATINKSLTDYQNTIASINVNQSPKQTASGYGTVSLPVNAANGQVSASVKGVSATNLITNGDFSNGTAGWSVSSASMSMSDNEVTVLASTEFGRFRNMPGSKVQINRKFYGRAMVKSTSSLAGLGISSSIISYHSGSGKYELLSYVYNNTAVTDYYLAVIDNRTENWDNVYLKDFMLIDLTATFGAGNEPTAEQCDAAFPTWFNGTKSTFSAGRLRAINKNLFNDVLEIGSLTGGANTSSPNDIRSKGFTKVTAQMQYTLSGFSSATGQIGVYFYDSNKVYMPNSAALASSNKISFVTPSNTVYLRFRQFGNTSLTDKIQLEPGATATAYEPPTYTTQYYPDCGILQSVGSANDEISFNAQTKQWGWIRRNQPYALQASDMTALVTTLANVDTIQISKPIDSIAYGNTTHPGSISMPPYGEFTTAIDSVANIGKIILVYSGINYHLVIAKGAYANLAAAQAALTGTVLTYQLASPIVTPINVTGTLVGYPNGTVYWEPVLPVAGLYTAQGITLPNADYPIAHIETISTLDFQTGLETPFAVEQAILFENKLGFTHPGLAVDDIVFLKYFHSVEGTEPRIDTEYYDSRYVVEDSAVPGKFYQIGYAVTNGEVVPTATEV